MYAFLISCLLRVAVLAVKWVTQFDTDPSMSRSDWRQGVVKITKQGEVRVVEKHKGIGGIFSCEKQEYGSGLLGFMGRVKSLERLRRELGIQQFWLGGILIWMVIKSFRFVTTKTVI